MNENEIEIEAKDLHRSYGPHRVLDGASLALRGGEYVVLTGDNGSGKTTLLHILMGLRRADSGQVIWKGEPLLGAGQGVWRRARASWGFLPQQVGLPLSAPVSGVMRFHAKLRGTDLGPVRSWLERVGLEDAEKRRVGELSGGMQQRLGIALTLFFEPQLVVMDEPASNLDPGWRGALAGWAEAHALRGGAMLVTSQLHEAWGERARFLSCEAGRIVEPPPRAKPEPEAVT